ncbi:MAG: thioredoxin domain-containing protein, partial [Gammaproteobacteria bacterium]|nr:thioredoxin domain-containing protein [Gammaproteobacteria bacterium]
PFFAGTYFPPVDRYGMRSFKSILQAVHNAYRDRREDIEQQNQSLRDHLQQIGQPQSHRAELTGELFAAMSQQLLEEYDRKHGGFTPKPKFPHAYFIEFCLRHYARHGENQRELLEAGLFSLRKMALGGLFDQIGGGFCRYSTDEQWMIPHFEKMLYDNGQLLPVYAWANQLQRDEDFARALTLTADWLMREMQSVEGGYFSAQDADSEGEEGRFYVWTPEEVAGVLSAQDYAIYAQVYGLDRSANFEGRWYPHTFQESAQVADNMGLSELQIRQSLETARQQLLPLRSQRIRPGTDDKVLTSWNALMIRGMLITARSLGRPQYADSAMRALDFIRSNMWQQGRLLASWKDGTANLNAYLDDYAYLLLAAIEALQARWDNALFEWCLELADSLIERFANEQGGGFYFTSHDHEKLIMRSQGFNDDAMPSGNAIAAQALYYLGYLSGETRYLDYAERTIDAVSMQIAQQPMAYAAMFNPVGIRLHSATIIILRGPQPELQQWRLELDQFYRPDVLCFDIDSELDVIAQLEDKQPLDGGVTAYVCQGMSCLPPVTRLAELKQLIEQNNGVPDQG